MNRDVATLAQEIVQYLTALVDAQVEIHATSSEGFGEEVVRTVSEDAGTALLWLRGAVSGSALSADTGLRPGRSRCRRYRCLRCGTRWCPGRLAGR